MKIVMSSSGANKLVNDSAGYLEQEIVSNRVRLNQLEIKLNAVLSWIKNLYGDEHEVFQEIGLSCFENHHRRRNSRAGQSDSEEQLLTQNPVVVISKAEYLRCEGSKETRTRRDTTHTSGTDHDVIGNIDIELPEPSGCRNANSSSTEREFSTVIDNFGTTHEIKTESMDDGLPDYDEDYQSHNAESETSDIQCDFYDSEISLSAGTSNWNASSLEQDQSQASLPSPGITDTYQYQIYDPPGTTSDLPMGQVTVQEITGVKATKENKCSVCNKSFVDHHVLKRHYESIHINANSFKCMYCGRSFSRKDTLDRHLTTHLKSNPKTNAKANREKKKQVSKPVTKPRRSMSQFTCQICHKIYDSQKSLRAHHKITHSTFTPYMCSICGKYFAKSTDLKAHIDLHSDPNARNYKCPYCDKAFRLKETMELHKTRHLSVGGSKQQCAVCGEIIGGAKSLARHIKCLQNLPTGNVNQSGVPQSGNDIGLYSQ